MIYVVLLNWNGFEDTKECIASLLKNSSDIEIVVVDNGSDNYEGKRLKEEFSSLHLIVNSENQGFARGVNQGIQYALNQQNCEYIFLLNNDTRVQNQETIPGLVHQCQHVGDRVLCSPVILYKNSHKIQNVGGKVSLYVGGSISLAKGREYTENFSPEKPDYLSGCAIFGRADLFRELEGMYEGYFAYFEDVEFSLSAKRRGVLLSVVPHITIEHAHSASTSSKTYIKEYLLLRNSIIFARRNLSGVKRYFFILNSILVRVLLGLTRRRFLGLSRLYLGIKDGFSESLSLNRL